MDISCSWCGKKVGKKWDTVKTPAICDACLTLLFPSICDKIRSILEVKNIEDIYTKGE